MMLHRRAPFMRSNKKRRERWRAEGRDIEMAGVMSRAPSPPPRAAEFYAMLQQKNQERDSGEVAVRVASARYAVSRVVSPQPLQACLCVVTAARMARQ